MTGGSSVESEIVSMKFENTQFEHAATTTLGTLDKLKLSLANMGKGAGTGLAEISNTVRGFHMNPLIDSASEVGKAFSSMSVVAITAIATVASEATQAGLGIVKSLSITPITEGFGEYNTTLGSIQTILSNTGLEGKKGLDEVNKSLNELNHYADKTIYNFTEMAKNIGTFTAAGVGLDESTAAIKGIANLAAVSGSTSQQASTAMYQLSQALASGTVKLMDWNSVVNAGMGGKVFKDAIMETARTHGVAIDEMIKKDGSFRDTLQEGWFTSDILTETLQKFTGDLSKSQLKSMGYTDEQIKKIEKLGKMANDAATKVKTLPQLFDTLKEAVGSGWTQTFQTIFGDFNQAKDTFTTLSNFLGNIVQQSANQRNSMLKDWAALGGRTKLISSVTNAWKALASVVNPIKDAFREIFPATTGMQLKNITKSINQFMRSIRLTKDAQENLKNTFAGLFAVMHIVFTIIGGVVHVLATLIGLLVKGQGSTLAFTGGIGKALVAFDAFLTKGQFIQKFFDGLANVLVAIIKPLLDIRSAVFAAFAGLVTGDPAAFFNGIGSAIQQLLGLVDKLSAGFASVVNSISDSMGGLGHIHGFDLSSMFGGASADKAKQSIEGVKTSLSGISGVGAKVKVIWDAIMEAIRGALGGAQDVGNGVISVWDRVMGIFHDVGSFLKPLTDQFHNVISAIKDSLSNIGSGGIDFSGVLQAINTGLFLAIFIQIQRFSSALTGVANAAQGVLKQVTSNLKTMQTEVRAQIIFQIAASLLLLAAAVFLLTKTNPKNLAIALGAVTAMLIELVAAMKVLEKSVKGMGGGAKLILVGVAFSAMAVGIAAMAGAVYLFSLMDFGQMQKGMLGVLEALAMLTAATAIMSKSGAGANMIGVGIGLTIMSVALLALLGAIEVYSKIDPSKLASGLVKIGAALLVLGVGMKLMQGSLGGAAAMAIIAPSLIILAKALSMFANMSKGDILKSMITLTAALAILAVGMAAMSEGLLGAAALIVMAAALTILLPVIKNFGEMSWETIGKGLLAMVGSMFALALAAGAISPIVPVLLALGAAVALIGAAVFLAGSGVLAFAGGLALLAHNGTAGFDVLITIIKQFIAELPGMINGFGAAIDAMVKLIGQKAPQLVVAFQTIIGAMLDAGVKLIPKFQKFLSALISAGIKTLVSYYSDMANAGLQLLINVLKAFDSHIDLIVSAATSLIIHFVQSLAKNGVKLANAGLQALIDFLNGLAAAIRSHSHEINQAGLNVAAAIGSGIVDGIRQLGSAVAGAIRSMVASAASSVDVKGIVKSFIPFARGVDALTGSFAHLVGGTDEVKDALSNILGQIQDNLSKSSDSIEKWKGKLKDLENAKIKNPEAIEHAKKMLKAAQDLHDSAEAAHEAYKKQMKSRGAELKDLAKQYDEMKKKIDDATASLDTAIKSESDFKDSINSTFGTLPDIEAGQTLASYMKQLQAEQDKVEKFKATLAALRAAGLDDDSYRQFLAEGVDAQRVMDQLLAGGPDAITKFEQANASLEAASQSLADMASTQLGYDSAVTSAQQFLNGLVHGLGDQAGLDQIEAQMGKIAKIMMKAIRKELNIKSPSQKAAEVGYYFVKGLLNKMDSMHRDVEKSTEALGASALSTLQTTMSRIGDGLGDKISMSPVITPVLDLTQLTKDANSISSLLSTNPIAASVSFSQASDISAGRQTTTDDEAPSTSPEPGDLYFYQTINAPKSPDAVEVYRNTKSLISTAKEALNV